MASLKPELDRVRQHAPDFLDRPLPFGANKPEQRNEADDPDASLPTPQDEEPQSATGKHRDDGG